MKTFAIACAAVVMFAATASAGEMAVSAATLDNMGLGGMQQLSDEEGMDVRGQGLFEDWFGGAVTQLVDTAIDFGDTVGGLGDILQIDFGGAFDFDFGNFNFGF